MNVVCIDDDLEDLEMLMEALDQCDFGVESISAPDGITALALLDHIDKPDFIFLDINMPGMNGIEALSRIRLRERLKDTPVIILSTGITPELSKRLLAMGATACMKKPDTYQELCSALSNLFVRQQKRVN